ncbi:MAG: hypothetical protein WBV94_20290 [Blastocatellia bacterium]
MQQAIVWLVVLLIIAGAFWALVRESKQKRNRTAQEYERDVAEAKDSLLRAGLVELDKFYGASRQKQAAVEYLKDEAQGLHKTGGRDDDSDRTASQSDGRK